MFTLPPQIQPRFRFIYLLLDRIQSTLFQMCEMTWIRIHYDFDVTLCRPLAATLPPKMSVC